MVTADVISSPLRSLAAFVQPIFLAAALAACGQNSPPQPEPTQTQAAPAQVEQPRSVVPKPQPALAKDDLLDAARQAASLYAGGAQASAKDPLVGRTFSVRIPFGCAGPALPGREEPGIAHWSWGADRKTIDLRMLPAEWKDSAMIARTGSGEKWEAVEGFWIPRPWLMSDGCPAAPADPLQTAAVASPQTLGLAAVFEAGGSRIGRRAGRAYQFTVREKEEPLVAPKDGYRLLLEGRVAAFPSGRAVECRASGPDERPVCVVAARLDGVAFETAQGDVLAEWRTD